MYQFKLKEFHLIIIPAYFDTFPMKDLNVCPVSNFQREDTLKKLMKSIIIVIISKMLIN